MRVGLKRGRVAVTMLFLCAAVAGISATAASGAKAHHRSPLKEYPFQYTITWSIKASFTTQCYAADGITPEGKLTGTVDIEAHSVTPSFAIWVPGNGWQRYYAPLTKYNQGKETWAMVDTPSIPASCPVKTVPKTCSGAWTERRFSIYDLNPQELQIREPVLPPRHNNGKPYGDRFYCFQLEANGYPPFDAPTWWPDSFPGAVSIDPNARLVAPDPSGLYDCTQHTLTSSFASSYTAKSTEWVPYDQSEQSSATITFTRIHADQVKRWMWVHHGYTKPVDGCG